MSQTDALVRYVTPILSVQVFSISKLLIDFLLQISRKAVDLPLGAVDACLSNYPPRIVLTFLPPEQGPRPRIVCTLKVVGFTDKELEFTVVPRTATPNTSGGV